MKAGLDVIATTQSDLDFQVSTDAASVREFLDAPFTGTNIIFSTDQSARAVGQALDYGGSSLLSPADELSSAKRARELALRKSGDKSSHSMHSKKHAFDLANFDEAHQPAGREDRHYAFALEDTNLPIRKRLVPTATLRPYNPQKRDQELDKIGFCWRVDSTPKADSGSLAGEV